MFGSPADLSFIRHRNVSSSPRRVQNSFLPSGERCHTESRFGNLASCEEVPTKVRRAVSVCRTESRFGVASKAEAEKLTAHIPKVSTSDKDDRVTIFTMPDGIDAARKPKEQHKDREGDKLARAPCSSKPPNKSSSLASMLRRRNAENRQAESEKTCGARNFRLPESRGDAEPEVGSQASTNDAPWSQEDAEEVSHPSSSSTTAPPPFLRVTYRYTCPQCSTIVDSEQAALAHCGARKQAPGLRASAAGAVQGMLSVLAFDSAGLPLISVLKDPISGKQCTVVRKDDGSERAFGDDTVQSCVEETEEKALFWLSSLTNNELKGLLNEFHHHAAESSKLYHETKSALDLLRMKVSYSFFGLQEHTSEKELDNAYRQLAKRMHPDKNGGTQEAKEKFQRMKEHYEAIKRHRAEDPGPQAEKSREENAEQRNRADEDEQVPSREAEKQEQKKALAKVSLSELLSETERSPLDKAALHMIELLKNIRSNMRILEVEQEKLSAHVPL